MPSKKSPESSPAPVSEALARLENLYGDAGCSLDFGSPLQLLAATILSAQCTDARVNMVTPELFRRFPTAAALAAAPPGALEDVIRSTGFFNAKAKSLRGMAKALVEKHGGEVPRTMAELHALPGVGRKTANVVLGNVWNTPDGVVVDTHVGRLARRLGWTKHADPVKVEQDLNGAIPKERWTWISHALILHGRRICIAQRPKCDLCSLADICPKIGVETKEEREKRKRAKATGAARRAGGGAAATGAARRARNARPPHAPSKKISSSSSSSSSSSRKGPR